VCATSSELLTNTVPAIQKEDTTLWFKKTSIPFSTVDLWLSQIARSDLSEAGRTAMALAFPNFLTAEAYQSEFQDAERAAYGDTGVMWIPEGQPRRFAGDQIAGKPLPSGCYYSVCEDSEGRGGTLLFELYAYHDAQRTGPICITFGDHDTEARHTGDSSIDGCIHNYQGPITRVMLSSLAGRPHVIAARFGFTEPDDVPLILPVKTVHERIENVIDLRLPATARWFARHFSTLQISVKGKIGVPHFPFKPRLRHFYEILPTILTQELGGGIFCQIVGLA
jgi:hypothetical protein